MTDQPDRSPARRVEVVRILQAPRERVFRAFTEASEASRWYGPKDHSVPVCEIEARTGGRFRICMRSATGLECWDEGTYREMAEPERMVADYTVRLDGQPPVDLEFSITFEALGDHTRLRIHQTFLPAHFTEGAEAGWNQTLDRLEAHLRTPSAAVS